MGFLFYLVAVVFVLAFRCMPGVKTGLKMTMNILGLELDDATTPYVFFVPNLGPLDR